MCVMSMWRMIQLTLLLGLKSRRGVGASRRQMAPEKSHVGIRRGAPAGGGQDLPASSRIGNRQKHHKAQRWPYGAAPAELTSIRALEFNPQTDARHRLATIRRRG